MAGYCHHLGNPLSQRSFLVQNEPVKMQQQKGLYLVKSDNNSNEQVEALTVVKSLQFLHSCAKTSIIQNHTTRGTSHNPIDT